MKSALSVIFSPINDYLKGVKLLSSEQRFASEVQSQRLNTSQLTKIALGSLLLTILIEEFAKYFIIGYEGVISEVQIPIIGELIYVFFFFVAGWLNAVIVLICIRSIIPESSDRFRKILFTNFVVIVLFFPITSLLEAVLMLIVGIEYYYKSLERPVTQGVNMGITFLIAYLLGSVFKLSHKKIINRLLIGYLVFVVVVFIVVILFLALIE